MAKKKHVASGVEWIGGLVSLPAYVSSEGADPYRPEALLWMSADGLVLGTQTFEPGEAGANLVDHFLETTRKPMIGPAHVPSRVRIESPELAVQLRAALGGATDVICAPTPEIDGVVASMREHMNANDDNEPRTHLGPGITPDAMRSFFAGSARLFRATPWKVLPDDTSVLRVTIESLGVRDAVLSVIGQLGESFGFLLFDSADDFDMFLDAAESIEEGDEHPALPRHFALNFERGAEIDPALRKEIASHGWEVAGSNAYPWLVAVDKDVVARPPTADELTRFEAIVLALAELVETERGLRECWEKDRSLVRTISAQTHAGAIAVALAAPYDDEDVDSDEDGLDEDDQAEEYRDAIVEEFAASAEASALGGEHGWADMVMEYGTVYCGVSAEEMRARDLEEILFEIIPRKVTCEPSVAGPMVDELRAFFAFLKRAHAMKNADACLRVLGRDAAKKVERALSDPRNFGMAKSLMMAGREAGFDVSTSDGAMAWVRAMHDEPLPPSFRMPALNVATPRAKVSSEAQRAKKNKRKAERKARRNNR